MVMNKNLLKIRERCLGPSMKIIYVHHAIMPRTHIANSTSMPNVLERYVQEGGFKIE